MALLEATTPDWDYHDDHDREEPPRDDNISGEQNEQTPLNQGSLLPDAPAVRRTSPIRRTFIC